MIIVKLQGGLGNQLYEYALYEKLKTLGKDVYLDDIDYTDKAFLRDIRDIELNVFKDIDLRYCTLGCHYRYADDKRTLLARVRRKLLGAHRRVVKEDGEYMPDILSSDNVLVDGFWQCQKYYEDIIPLLRKKLVFKEEYNSECADMLAKIESSHNPVSIHIRLGDYVAKAETYGGISTDEYYRSAIRYIKDKAGDIELFLFSDDVKEAGRMLNSMRVAYTPVSCNTKKEECAYDMMLMSKCKHNICANSSFSIWGATLNGNQDKIVVRPLKSNTDSNVTSDEMKSYWSGWVLIDEKGIIV